MYSCSEYKFNPKLSPLPSLNSVSKRHLNSPYNDESRHCGAKGGGGGGRVCLPCRLFFLLRYFIQNKQDALAPWVPPLGPPLPYSPYLNMKSLHKLSTANAQIVNFKNSYAASSFACGYLHGKGIKMICTRVDPHIEDKRNPLSYLKVNVLRESRDSQTCGASLFMWTAQAA